LKAFHSPFLKEESVLPNLASHARDSRSQDRNWFQLPLLS
jgi:hypothetical protein